MKNIKKGHLTVMWNVLFQKAYDEGCEYFFQVVVILEHKLELMKQIN